MAPFSALEIVMVPSQSKVPVENHPSHFRLVQPAEPGSPYKITAIVHDGEVGIGAISVTRFGLRVEGQFDHFKLVTTGQSGLAHIEDDETHEVLLSAQQLSLTRNKTLSFSLATSDDSSSVQVNSSDPHHDATEQRDVGATPSRDKYAKMARYQTETSLPLEENLPADRDSDGPRVTPQAKKDVIKDTPATKSRFRERRTSKGGEGDETDDEDSPSRRLDHKAATGSSDDDGLKTVARDDTLEIPMYDYTDVYDVPDDSQLDSPVPAHQPRSLQYHPRQDSKSAPAKFDGEPLMPEHESDDASSKLTLSARVPPVSTGPDQYLTPAEAAPSPMPVTQERSDATRNTHGIRGEDLYAQMRSSQQPPAESDAQPASSNGMDMGSASSNGTDMGRIPTETPAFAEMQRFEASSEQLAKSSQSGSNAYPARLDADKASTTGSKRGHKRKATEDLGQSLNFSPADENETPRAKRARWSQELTASDNTPSSSKSSSKSLNTRSHATAKVTAGPGALIFSNSDVLDSKTRTFLKKLKVDVSERFEDTDFDVLVVGQGPLKRTPKLLFAVAQGKEIVTDQWVTDSFQAGHMLRLESFRIARHETAKQWGLNYEPRTPRSSLLADKDIQVSPKVKKEWGPSGFKSMGHLVKVLGASSFQSKKPLKSEKGESKVYIVSDKGDVDANVLLSQGLTCYTTEMIPVSILRGEIDWQSIEYTINAEAYEGGGSSGRRKGKR